jgi:hypothetical protein
VAADGIEDGFGLDVDLAGSGCAGHICSLKDGGQGVRLGLKYPIPVAAVKIAQALSKSLVPL